jgi:hypothetical protein
MNLGEWLNSLSALDHGLLLALYIFGVYLSKITIEALIEFYDTKKQHSKFRVQFRVTPAVLLSLAFIYSLIIYKIIDTMFNFMP